MTHRLLYLLSLLLLMVACRPSSSPSSVAMSQADSLLEASSACAERGQADSALSLMGDALQLGVKDDTVKAMVYAEMANQLLIKGRMDSALQHSLQAIELGERLHNDEVLINQYATIGVIYRRLGRSDSAAVYYLKGIATAKRVNAKDYVANLMNNISVLYVEEDRLREGLHYAREAERFALEATDTIERYSALSTQAAVEIRLKHYQRVIALLRPHFATVQRLGHDGLVLKMASPLLRAYVEMGQPDRAQEAIRSIAPTLQRVEATSNGSIGIREIEAAAFHAKGDYQAELSVFEKIEALNRENLGVPWQKVWAAEALAHERLGHSQQALSLMKQAYQQLDSLKNTAVGRELSKLSAKYRLQEKELEIVRLDRAKATQRVTLLTIIAVVSFICFVITVCLFRLRQRKNQAQHRYERMMHRKYVEGLEEERARLARELHDGVCNDLLGLSMQVGSQLPPDAADTLKHIREDVRHVSHELMPPRFGRSDIHEILQDYLGHYVLNGCTISYSASPEVEWNRLPDEIAYQIYRITQEVINNIALHSKATMVEAQLTAHTDRIELAIHNDGVNDLTAGGIGSMTIANRVSSINGRLSTSCCGGCYYFLLTIPLLSPLDLE